MAHIERLTPLHVAMPRTYIRVLLLFRAAIAASAAQTLQDGLNKLAEQVPWVSGRIYSVSGGGQEIRYDAEKINPPILLDKGSIAASYTMSSHGKSMDAIAPEVWPVSGALTGDGAPVFAASVFRFATPDLDPQEGTQGIALCVCIHHNAVDATGFTEIIRLWARNVAGPDLSFSTCSAAPDRGSRHAHLLTTLSSELEELEISSPLSDAILASHSEYSKTPPVMPPNGLAPCTSKLFSIPVHWVNILKGLLRKYVCAPPTANVVLCTLLWTTITRVRARRNPSLMSQKANYRSWDLFGSRDVVITSWADQDYTQLTLGPRLDGQRIVLPRRREKAEMEVLEVILMLRVDDMRALEDDSFW
ncbi:hypothetical protein BDV09DRAFT_190220 [Aspergillus tetrazonus]